MRNLSGANTYQKLIQSKVAATKAYFELSQTKINSLRKIITEIKSNNLKIKKDKGDLLEKLIVTFFENSELFNIVQNCRSTTNEIDLVISLTIQSKVLRNEGIFPPWFPDRFLVECKNYDAKVGVTYIGKFYSLVKVSNYNLGLFITTNGVTGFTKNKMTWNDASGLIKKINLKHSLSSPATLLIPVNVDQIDDILLNSHGNIIELIEQLKTYIDLDVNADINIVHTHPNTGRVNVNI